MQFKGRTGSSTSRIPVFGVFVYPGLPSSDTLSEQKVVQATREETFSTTKIAWSEHSKGRITRIRQMSMTPEQQIAAAAIQHIAALPRDYDLLREMLLLSSRQHHGIATLNVHMFTRALVADIGHKIRAWLPIFKMPFIIKDMDWYHFLILTYLPAVDAIYSVFAQVGNRRKLDNFLVSLELAKRDLVAVVQDPAPTTLSTTMRTDQASLALQSRTSIRQFVWKMRSAYLMQ